MNFARCCFFATVGLILFLACRPMDAGATTVQFPCGDIYCSALPGFPATEAFVCTNEACNNGNDFLNSEVVNTGGAGGVVAMASAEFAQGTGGTPPAPAVTSAQAGINQLSVLVDTGSPPGPTGAGTASAFFTDVVDLSQAPGFSTVVGTFDAVAELAFNPSSRGPASLTPTLIV